MNGLLLSVGTYLLLGVLFTAIRWKRIAAIARPLVGAHRVHLVVPILALVWPLIAIAWFSDEVKVAAAARQVDAATPKCACGERLRITRARMRELRDEGRSVVKCVRCDAVTELKPQRAEM